MFVCFNLIRMSVLYLIIIYYVVNILVSLQQMIATLVIAWYYVWDHIPMVRERLAIARQNSSNEGTSDGSNSGSGNSNFAEELTLKYDNDDLRRSGTSTFATGQDSHSCRGLKPELQGVEV